MKTCLVVDDSRVVRKVAGRIIENLSFEIDEAGDGAEALKKCRECMPDAILLDWSMPVMNGLDFLKALRREDGGDKPVVVFCSSETKAEHIREALSFGANEFIMKPFDADIVKSKFELAGLLA